MKYLFLFSFSFDDDSQRSCAFTLDESAVAKLGITSPNGHSLPEGHMDWMEEVSAALEERFGAVHDFSGTEDENTLVEGFTTYEAAPEATAEIMEAWRGAFAWRLQGEDGISAVASCEGNPENPPAWEDASLTPTAIADLVTAAGMAPPFRHTSSHP